MRIHKYTTDYGVTYAHTDGTLATESDWLEQCRRWAENARERERIEQERQAGLVYSDEPVRYKDGRQGGYSVDEYDFANNGLIF